MKTLILAATLSLAASTLSAQTVHEGIGVRVVAPTVLLGRFEGVFLGRRGDTLQFGNDERGPVSIPASAITALDVSGGRSRSLGALRGAVWGAGLMAAFAAIAVSDTATYNASSDGSKGTFIAQGIASGAVLGAAIGAFVPKRLWRRAEPALFLNVPRGSGIRRMTPGALGVQLALGFSR